MTNAYYDNRVQLTCTHNDKVVEAEIDNFKAEDGLNAYVAGNKIYCKYNGRVYVGNKMGMEFTTPGPKQIAKRYNGRI